MGEGDGFGLNGRGEGSAMSGRQRRVEDEHNSIFREGLRGVGVADCVGMTEKSGAGGEWMEK